MRAALRVKLVAPLQGLGQRQAAVAAQLDIAKVANPVRTSRDHVPVSTAGPATYARVQREFAAVGGEQCAQPLSHHG